MGRKSIHRRDRAASGMTYGLLVGLIAVLALGSVVSLGSGVNRLFGRTAAAITGVGCNGAACGGSGSAGGSFLRTCKSATAGSGAYDLDPDGDGQDPIRVWCDMTATGGGWALVMNGLNTGNANLITDAAVNAVALVTAAPAQSAKLSRSQIAALLAAGEGFIRYGEPRAAHDRWLFAGPMQASWLSGGRGGYGNPLVDANTPVTPNIASLGFTVTAGNGALGTTFSGSRFSWTLGSVPGICLNSDGGSGHCGGGLHYGGWVHNGLPGLPRQGDAIYTNGGAVPAGSVNFQLWVR